MNLPSLNARQEQRLTCRTMTLVLPSRTLSLDQMLLKKVKAKKRRKKNVQKKMFRSTLSKKTWPLLKRKRPKMWTRPIDAEQEDMTTVEKEEAQDVD